MLGYLKNSSFYILFCDLHGKRYIFFSRFKVIKEKKSKNILDVFFDYYLVSYCS